MNRPGQGRPLQSVTNLATQSSQNRATANSRIPASKSNSWAQAGIPGLQSSTAQPRDSGAMAPDNWAQAMSSRGNAPLDLSSSSFPSLNNSGPQSQSHSIGSSAWQTGPPQAEQQRQQLQNARTQLSSRQQQQSSARDGFYPTDTFSRNAPMEYTNVDQSSQSARRSSAAPNGPPGLVQRPPNQLSDSLSADPSRVTSPAGIGHSSRSPASQGLNGTIGQDRPFGDAGGQSVNERTRSQTNDFLPQSPQTSQMARDVFSDREGFEQSQVGSQDPAFETLFEGMSAKDRWGMKGYVALQDGPNSAMRNLIRGQDLSTLGLNMNSETALLSTYSGPFARPNAPPLRPLDAEFTIPECYTVKKVAPLQSRISGFMDETLFYIFYTMPRDYMQVLVAQELVERKWRYHMREQMWMTRDENTLVAPAVQENSVSEEGWYVFWEKNLWRKTRKFFHLKYADLDDQPQSLRRNMNSGLLVDGGNGVSVVAGLERMAASGRGF